MRPRHTEKYIWWVEIQADAAVSRSPSYPVAGYGGTKEYRGRILVLYRGKRECS